MNPFTFVLHTSRQAEPIKVTHNVSRLEELVRLITGGAAHKISPILMFTNNIFTRFFFFQTRKKALTQTDAAFLADCRLLKL